MRYRRATSLAEAIAHLGDGAIPLAGGTVIVPEAVRRGGGPDVVDLSRIEALDALTALVATAAEVGNPHVRLCGSLGGNLGYRAPYPNLPPALIALGATA